MFLENDNKDLGKSWPVSFLAMQQKEFFFPRFLLLVGMYCWGRGCVEGNTGWVWGEAMPCYSFTLFCTFLWAFQDSDYRREISRTFFQAS